MRQIFFLVVLLPAFATCQSALDSSVLGEVNRHRAQTGLGELSFGGARLRGAAENTADMVGVNMPALESAAVGGSYSVVASQSFSGVAEAVGVVVLPEAGFVQGLSFEVHVARSLADQMFASEFFAAALLSRAVSAGVSTQVFRGRRMTSKGYVNVYFVFCTVQLE